MDRTLYLIGAAVGLVLIGILIWLIIALRRKARLERDLAAVVSDQALCRQQLENQTRALADAQSVIAGQDDRLTQLQVDAGNLGVAKASLEVQVSEKCVQIEKADGLNHRQADQINGLQDDISHFKARTIELKTLLDDERKQAAEKITLLNEARDQLKNEFQILAHQIFEDKSQKFAEQNRDNITHLINPLRDQIGDFKKRVEDVYDKESRDRVSLQAEIHHLKELNQRISKEALNLTRALKGDSKVRGNWGEVVLERVLEVSGLQKGREYETQVSLKDGDGKRYQPDVIVRLPQGKDVVVDAKVSLNDYEVYYSAEDTDQKELALKSHIEAVRTHIRSLAGKSYEDLEGVRSLDFVLMFIPIEAAFAVAVERDRGLFSEAFDKNIMVVSPSTLLVTLRTIENIWRHEYQNRHAIEIAKKAGGLYDKFVGFVEALEQVGQQLDKAKAAYRTASDRLVDGRGNLIRRTQELKALGVKAGKELPQKMLDMAADGEFTEE